MSKKPDFRATTEPKPNQRWRITLVVEGLDEDLNGALKEALYLGTQRYVGMSYKHNDDRDTHVSCRTAKARKRK